MLNISWPGRASVSQDMKFGRAVHLAFGAGLELAILPHPISRTIRVLLIGQNEWLVTHKEFPYDSIDAASDWINKQVNDFLTWK